MLGRTMMSLALIGWADAALAGPLQLDDVAAGAKWLLHLDVEQLRQTRVGDQLEARMDADQAAAKLDAFAVIFNFDPRKDLRGVTLYGAEGRPDRSAVLLYGAFDEKRLVTLVRANGGYRRLKHGREVLHSWLDDDCETRTYGWIREGVSVLSKGRTMIEQAVDVLTGKAPGLSADGDWMETLGDAPAVFVIAAVNLEGLEDIDLNAALLRKARAVQLSVREVGDEVACRGWLRAESVRTAELAEKVLEGMVAFGLLQEGEHPRLTALAEAARVRRDGATIEFEMSHAVDGVVEFLEKEMAQRRGFEGDPDAASE